MWLAICRTGPVLLENGDFVNKEVLVVKDSCFWLARVYETCLITLFLLVLSDVRDALCFASFLLLEAKEWK